MAGAVFVSGCNAADGLVQPKIQIKFTTPPYLLNPIYLLIEEKREDSKRFVRGRVIKREFKDRGGDAQSISLIESSRFETH